MSIKTRSLVFATFFGSCLAVGLILASLTTDHWIHASAKRVNSSESFGEINYGLFTGMKHLNVGYGNRSHHVHVVTLIRTEPNIMNFWLWLGAALGTGFGLLSSAISAIASILKAASASNKHGVMVLLFIANIASAGSQILAFICWLVQFYMYLTHNVLAAEDLKLNWYSNGRAYIGFSFYFIVVSIIIVIVNIVILITAYRNEKRETRVVDSYPLEDKTQSAIMLY